MLNFIQYLGAVLNLDLSAFFAAYWALVILAVGFIVYLIVARAKAKQLILGLMLQVEKNAEDYLLANGDQMFSYVVNRAYPLLPPVLRLLISYDAFKILAQKLYDEAKDYLIKGNELNPPSSPVPPRVVDDGNGNGLLSIRNAAGAEVVKGDNNGVNIVNGKLTLTNPDDKAGYPIADSSNETTATIEQP